MNWLHDGIPIVNIVGVGKVSASIARQFKGKVKFGYIVSRNIEKARLLAKEIGGIALTYEDEFKLHGIVLLGLNDSALSTAHLLLNGKVENGEIVAIHFSGYLTSDVLPQEWFPASVHPNCAVSDEYHRFENVIFGIEGSEEGLKIATTIVKLLGGEYVIIPKERKPEYHLAAVIVSNFPIALAYLSQNLYKNLGFSDELARRVIATLLSSVSANINLKKLPDALTGPVKRNDWMVVKNEKEIFEKMFPEYKQLYDTIVEILTKLISEKHL
ncbi:Rossmann-like and DUF2520 domain-containing protein [Fervidobacterium sp.]